MNDPADNPYTAPATSPVNLFKGQGPVTINAAATTGMIITFSLLSGVLTIAGVLLFMMPERDVEQPIIRFDQDSLIFLIIGFGVFIGSAIAAVFIRKAMHQQSQTALQAAGESLPQPLRGDTPLPVSAQSFVGAFATYTLIGQALMEGPAVVNLVLMYLDNNYTHLIPVLLGAVGILLQIPTASRLQGKLESARNHAPSHRA